MYCVLQAESAGVKNNSRTYKPTQGRHGFLVPEGCPYEKLTYYCFN
jgi:hypothetical protein